MKALTKNETNADGKRKPVAGTKQISHLQFSKEELQMKKKLVSVLLATSMVLSLVACTGGTEATSDVATGTSEGGQTTVEAPAGDYDLTSIKMVVDGTLTANLDNRQDAFIEQWQEAIKEETGRDVTLNINQLDHSGYVDAVGRLFAGGDYPDVMIMPASMYAQYASTGILWDMTDAYNNAEFQSRMEKPEINEGLKRDGKLYGFSPAYGNGCVTYVKTAWLDAVGLKASDIKTYDDYYNMLLKFTNEDPDGNGKNDTYGTIAAGFMKTDEAPYINYLPEFWQDAYPAIYQNESGEWVDGFTEDATKQALIRLQKAYKDGVIDPETLTASTKIAREKYFSNEQSGSSGSFAYWAGTWYQTLTDNLVKNDVDTELVMLDPIAEVGSYINREAPVWVIIDDQDGDNSREQAIFDTFIDTMLDGGKVQVLWTYGAEDVHWSTKAESFVLNAGTDNEKSYEYADGEFHLKQSPNDANTLWKKNAMDPALVIAPLVGEYADFTSTSELAAQGNLFFVQHCKDAHPSPSCETLTNESGTIQDAQNRVISAVIVEGKDVDAALADYEAEAGAIVAQALSELNAQ